MAYLNNITRTKDNTLLSKFPSIYILFNVKNNGIKKTLTDIRGYRAIKKNKLFDMEYYLKNNNDVRVSGVNPILHYIYYGFNEG